MLKKNAKKNKFDKSCFSCKIARELSRKYRKKAHNVHKTLRKNCKKYKIKCFRRNLHCKKMFKTCKRANKTRKQIKDSKAHYFARVFASIIAKIH